MKQFIRYLPMLLLLVACSCKKNTVTPPPTVYVAGEVNNKAALWKNGIVQTLTNQPNNSYSSSYVTSVFVSDTDVYLGGSAHNSVTGRDEPTVWKNGAAVSYFGPASSINSIYVSGTDLYAISSGNDPAISILLYKNNVAIQALSGMEYATYVFVHGSEVYIAGTSSASTAVLWANGFRQYLPDQSHGSEADAVFVVDNEVYVVGYVRTVTSNPMVTIWKNGIAQYLTDGTNVAYGQGLYVSGNDMYVAGYIVKNGTFIAMLWKNGAAQALTDGTSNAFASSVFVSGNNVYVAGSKTVGGMRVATLWKNGVATSLSGSNDFAQAEAVFVTNN